MRIGPKPYPFKGCQGKPLVLIDDLTIELDLTTTSQLKGQTLFFGDAPSIYGNVYQTYILIMGYP